MGRTTGGVLKEVLREREAQAWALRQKLYTHERIAAELGLDRSTISKMLKRLALRSDAKIMDEVVTERIAQLGQMHWIADEAAQAWQRSKEARKGVTKRTSSGKANRFGKAGQQGEEMTIATRDQDGDPRYLSLALATLADIRKLLGLDAATQTDVTSGGRPLPSGAGRVVIFLPQNGREVTKSQPGLSPQEGSGATE